MSLKGIATYSKFIMYLWLYKGQLNHIQHNYGMCKYNVCLQLYVGYLYHVRHDYGMVIVFIWKLNMTQGDMIVKLKRYVLMKAILGCHLHRIQIN